MTTIRSFVLALAALALVGCTMPMGAPQASMTAVEKLRGANVSPMKVGTFAPSPALARGDDSSTTIRASVLSPPDKSFAKYLGRTIEEDLKAAGRLDVNADLVVEGLLTETHVDSTMGTATAKLGAQFSLKRAGQTVFDKHLVVDSKWDSSFIGAVAIPDAANHYTMLYDELAKSLFSDPDFLAAAKAK
jgi:hypothetical protein